MFKLLPNAVKMAHRLVAAVLPEGATAIDATVGNGHDTLFLARNVGSLGKVYGFDIQTEALQSADDRLRAAGCRQQVTMIQAGHETMTEHIAGPVDAVMFNLGYLPGGDHGQITRADTTITAIEAGMKLLRPGGLMSIVVYTGHPGAAEERESVERLVRQLERREYCVVRMEFVNRSKKPPYLILIEKNDGSRERGKSNEESAT